MASKIPVRKTSFEERVEIVKYCIEHEHNYFSGKKVFKYRFAHNQVYGFEGAEKIFDEMLKMLDSTPNNYSLFLED